MENLSINTMADVRCFFYYLIHEMELGAGFHPDTPMGDYVNRDSKQPTFTPDQATRLQLQMDQCYHVCYTTNNDIYEQGVEPRAYIKMLNTPEMKINGCVISWTGEKWTCTDELGTVSGWREFDEAVGYAQEA